MIVEHVVLQLLSFVFFFFNDTATTEIYTLSLHDALPISDAVRAMMAIRLNVLASGLCGVAPDAVACLAGMLNRGVVPQDRKSTRLNSSHANISYAVFCLKKKKKHLI